MYSKLIRDIKTAANNTSLPAEFLVDLGAEYSEACEAVNHRLTRIVSLLIEGYRDEAVQLAEQNPNVLDLVAQLDFPEKETWIDVLAENQLELPPALMMEAAAQLERAYDELRQLEPLLKKNRLLALSQAPLQSRILILKKLAQQDPTNPIWPSDAEELQRARLVQIKEEYQRARAKNNSAELSRLDQELRQPWDIPIPKSLLSNVNDASTSLAKTKARQAMVAVAEQLNECLLEYDSETARQLRDQWNELNQTAKLTPNDDVFRSATEPLHWLTELDQDESADREFDLAVRDLERGIEEHVSIDVLDRKIYLAQKFEREMPEALVHRVNHYRDSLLVAKRRKMILSVCLVAIVMIACAAAVAWFLYQRNIKRTIVDARQQMSRFVEEEGFQPGKDYFDALSESIRVDGEIIRLHDQLIENESAEAERQGRIDQLVLQMDLVGPLDFKMNDVLKELDLVVKTDGEKSQAEILRNKLNTERLTRQSNRDTQFMDQLEPFRDQLELLTRKKGGLGTIDELKAIVTSLENLEFSSTAMVDGMAGISSSIKQNSNNLMQKAKAKIKEIETINQAAVRLGKLKGDLSDFNRFSLSLQAFSDRFPNDANAGDFSKTAKEKNVWNGFNQWRSIANTFEVGDLESLSPERAGELFEKLKAATVVLKITNWEPSIKELGNFLSAKKDSQQDGKALVGRLTATFEQAVFNDIEVVQRDDARYYLVEKRDGTTERFKFFQSNGSTRSTKLLKDELAGQAPHCDVSKQIVALLKKAPEYGAYESLVFEMLDLALASPTGSDNALEIDPAVQCEIVDQILLFAKLTSSELKGFAEAQRNVLEARALVGLNWKAYDDDDTVKARGVAPKFLAEFRDKLEAVRTTIQPSNEGFAQMAEWTQLKEYRVVGFIYRNESNWRIETAESIDPQTPVYCLAPSGTNEAILERIGNYDSGILSDRNESASLQAGRPIFIQTLKN